MHYYYQKTDVFQEIDGNWYGFADIAVTKNRNLQYNFQYQFEHVKPRMVRSSRDTHRVLIVILGDDIAPINNIPESIEVEYIYQMMYKTMKKIIADLETTQGRQQVPAWYAGHSLIIHRRINRNFNLSRKVWVVTCRVEGRKLPNLYLDSYRSAAYAAKLLELVADWNRYSKWDTKLKSGIIKTYYRQIETLPGRCTEYGKPIPAKPLEL